MPKYQFFTFPYNQTTDFTYLEMGTGTFLEEKESLLEQDFEVDGDPIYAKDAFTAVKIYQTGFTRTVHEYNLSNPLYALVHGLIELVRTIAKRR